MAQMILYIAVALAAGLLFNRFAKLVALPNVTGYLIAGLLIGPSVLNIIPKDGATALEPFVDVALGFIAFSIGGEFKLSNIRQIGTKALLITLFESLTAVLCVDVVLWAWGFEMPLVLILGAISAATAPAATLMVVRQYKAKGPVTQTLLPVVASDDAVGLIAFAISISIAQAIDKGGEMSIRVMLLEPILKIILSLALGAAIGTLMSLALRFFHSRDNFLAMSVMAVLLGVGLASLWGLSSLLLCMSIGAFVSNLRNDSEKILEGCDRWTAPLFMLFFVLSGAELDLSIIPSVGLLGFIYIFVRSIGKYTGASIGSLVLKADPNVRKYLGFALLPQAGVAIGMAQMCSAMMPKYAAQINTVVLSATLVYELFGPSITKFALSRAGEITTIEKRKKNRAQV